MKKYYREDSLQPQVFCLLPYSADLSLKNFCFVFCNSTINFSPFSFVQYKSKMAFRFNSVVARFSFLLSLPAILGASLVKFDEFLDLSQSEFISYLAGAIAAFISGYLVIATLIKLIQNKNLKIFSFYCWAISIISVVLYLIK